MEKYRFISHTADIKFQAFGKNTEECFINSACALKDIITHDKVKSLVKKEMQIKGKDLQNLLYRFLEEFLFLIDTENLILAEVKNINIINEKSNWILKAEVFFDNIKNYSTITDIKAITYNEMIVDLDEKTGKCNSQVVVDV